MLELKENDLFFAKVRPDAKIPTKRSFDAGYDLYACFDDDFIVIPALQSKLVSTGIASTMTDKYYIQIEERGSTAVKNIKKSAGIIDSSFRGEVFVCLYNANDSVLIISKLPWDELKKKYAKKDSYNDWVFPYGEDENDVIELDYDCPLIYPYDKAIAQAIVHEVPKMNVYEVSYEELLTIPSERGTGQIGSSGK